MSSRLAIFFLFILISNVSCANERLLEYAHLPNEVTITLFYPEEISLFTFTSKKEESKGSIGKFFYKQVSKISQNDDYKTFRNYLFNEGYYKKGPLKTPFFSPEKALLFHRDGKKVLLLMSFSSKQMLYLFEEKSWLFDFDKGKPIIHKKLQLLELNNLAR